jgi:hypothetical protein
VTLKETTSFRIQRNIKVICEKRKIKGTFQAKEKKKKKLSLLQFVRQGTQKLYKNDNQLYSDIKETLRYSTSRRQ